MSVLKESILATAEKQVSDCQTELTAAKEVLKDTDREYTYAKRKVESLETLLKAVTTARDALKGI